MSIMTLFIKTNYFKNVLLNVVILCIERCFSHIRKSRKNILKWRRCKWWKLWVQTNYYSTFLSCNLGSNYVDIRLCVCMLWHIENCCWQSCNLFKIPKMYTKDLDESGMLECISTMNFICGSNFGNNVVLFMTNIGFNTCPCSSP